MHLPSISLKDAFSAARRSTSCLRSRLSPFRKSRSKGMRITCTLMLSSVASLRARDDRIWNGSSLPLARSTATASQSKTKEVTPSPMAAGSMEMRSGYLLVMSSQLRLNTRMLPSGSRCTCARSPSYLNSHVNLIFSNRSSTSPMPCVGLASMGSTAMPGRRKQRAERPGRPT
jgi:hypothetical protein